MFSCAESGCDRHPERSRGIPLRKLKGNVPGISRPSLGMTVIVGRVRLPFITPATGSGCPTNARGVTSLSFMNVDAEKQLRVVSLTNLEDVKIGDDKTMRFRATVITAPEFDLPDYKNITVQLPPLEVTEEEANTAMERLRDQSADFVEVENERALQMEDFAVIDFEGTIEGRPISKIAPEASKNLHGGKK